MDASIDEVVQKPLMKLGSAKAKAST